jgi:hypothetical protein
MLLLTNLLQATATTEVKRAFQPVPKASIASSACATEQAAYAAAYQQYLVALDVLNDAYDALQFCEAINDPEEPEDPESAAVRLEQLASMHSILER